MLAVIVRPYSSQSLYPECFIFVLFRLSSLAVFLCHSQNSWSLVVMGGGEGGLVLWHEEYLLLGVQLEEDSSFLPPLQRNTDALRIPV